MISALLYLQYHSVKNRVIMRVKRLKQPKYLLGAIAGGLYFYFYFFRYLSGFPGGPAVLPRSSLPDPVFFESLGAMALLIIILPAWIIPYQRTSLVFTETEVAFLFPAPISRRGLIHFKLLRSQTAILFTTLLFTLFANRLGGQGWIHYAGGWLILSTLNLHLLGSSFARTRLLDRGITNWQRRMIILAFVLSCAIGVGLWACHTMPGIQLAQLESGHALKQYFEHVLQTGPAPYLLFPFRLMVRPYLAQNGSAFLSSVWPALLLMLLHYAWVVRSDVAFEEASVEASRKMAERIAAMRAGNWRTSNRQHKIRRPPFALRPTGPPAVALLWKNLISAGQTFTLRLWIILIATSAGASVGLGQTFGKAGWVASLGMIAAMLIVWSIVFGPQFLRQDFRQDFSFADILKTYPLRGWQIAIGELLAPSVILTCIQWLLLVIGAGLFSQAQELVRPSLTLGIALGAAIVLPMINLITLQIPNGAVLLFPAWFQASRDGAHGIEATGQRLVFMLGQLLTVIIALIPAAGFFAGAFFVLQMFLGIGMVIPLASLFAAFILSLEAAVGLMLLGWLFERLDISSEQTP